MKKLISIILSLALLCGCTTTNNSDSKSITDFSSKEGTKYIELLKNFTSCEKNENNIVDNEEFDDFLDELFLDQLDDSYMTMSYIVKDYREYGIEKPELSLGDFSYADNTTAEYYIEYLNRMDNFDTSTLSYRQQYDYDSLKYSLLETIALDYYSDLSPIFGMRNNICESLIGNFTDFTFYYGEQVDDYLVLLQDVDRYLDDALEYVSKQINDGIYISDTNLDYEIKYINSFLEKVDDNELIVSFNNSIDSLDFLTAEQKETYKNSNKEIVINEVIPAFKKVSSELNNYYGLFDYSKGALINVSSEYAQLCYLVNGSNNYSVDDTFELLESVWTDLANAYLDGINNTVVYSEFQSLCENYGFLSDYCDEDIVEYHIANYEKSFPLLDNISYEVSDLDASIASDTILAYYIQARIDELQNNVIKVNPNTTGEDKISTYCVLAHEGIPGHLYQHIYYWSQNPHPFRSMQGFLSYTEGFAIYAQNLSVDWFDCKYEGTKDIIKFDNCYYFILYSLIDLGVNYYGWSANELYEYLQKIGLNIDENGSEYYYELLIDMPGTYCTYGIGYAYFSELKSETKDMLGNNFNEVTFNEYLLKNGPLPFNLLVDCVGEYINKYAS